MLNGTSNLSDDGREDKDAKHKVDDDERILGVSDRQWQVCDGRHRQRRPEERLTNVPKLTNGDQLGQRLPLLTNVDLCRPEERVQIHATKRGVDRIQHRVDAVVDEHVMLHVVRLVVVVLVVVVVVVY